MLSFIQRVLASDSGSRKRKRSFPINDNSEVDDLRQILAEHNMVEDDRERSINDFLALADQPRDNKSGLNKRRKASQQGVRGRLSTISEKQDEEQEDKDAKEKDINAERLMQRQADRPVTKEEQRSDVEMMDVDLKYDIHPGAIHRDEHSNDGMVVDQDLWTWKGGNGMWR